METRAEKSSPPYEGGVAAVSADGVVLSSSVDLGGRRTIAIRKFEIE